MKKTNEVSKIVGVSRRTIQYYDDEGLLMVERTPNNQRLFDEHALTRIWEILIYKEMNLELKEIKCLLGLEEDQKKRYLENHMKEIGKEITKLQVQMGFISLVQIYGMPEAPTAESGKTYVKRIEELRKKIKMEVMIGKGK